MDKNRVRQLLALWAVVLAGMAAFAAVVLLHLQNTVYAMKNNIENGIYIPDDTRRLFTPTIVYTKNLIIWQRFTKKE